MIPGNRTTSSRARRHASGLCLLWLALGFALGSSFQPAASAQISPGPLSRPHQSLGGVTNCTACHKLGSMATLKCEDCHADIASRIASHKGLHGSYKLAPGSSQECARCHSEHNGEDFPLIKWDLKIFDHRQTGYLLEGKHASLTCNQCHAPAYIVAAERPTIKLNLARTYLGLTQTCASCHKDEHNGRLGQNCLQCHTYQDWKSVNVGAGPGQFDHSKTRFPLTGLHGPVACAKCHISGPDGKLRYAGIPFSLCSDCHKDPHQGSFPQACSSCHTTASWKKISLAIVDEKFDHSKTKYPLLGKHASVDCAKCHAGGNFKKPVEFATCANCHKPDPHSGQFAKRPAGGECSFCHTVDGWKPSTFTLKEHAATQYPLMGGHAKLKCEQCHVSKGKETQFKIKFGQCTDCHSDQHAGQFAAAPYQNACDRCHTVEGYKPSTFSLVRHKQTRFVLTGGHIAVPCADCHKESAEFKPKPAVIYHWKQMECTSCHEDPHQGQFREHMQQSGPNGKPAGCETCHSTKSWKDLSRFDHAKTSFPLLGAHRATACMDCHKPSNLETKLIHVDFKAAPKQCEDCHEDAHGKQFAKSDVTRCVACHNSNKWRPAQFDHETRTEFPLRGVHQNVSCAGCHKLTRVVASKTVLFYKPTPKQCESCHGPTPAVSKHS